jgi:hypothetical protein
MKINFLPTIFCLYIFTRIHDFGKTLRQCFHNQNKENYENKYLDNLDPKEEKHCALIHSVGINSLILK